ncbi:MAG: triphosphoribosyl-dephospho-CoA synthase CitG [Lachnospiraceae bacterium]|nr:triphosphoribosyl-dephospho-CoA synthase CitG [Lachnospiraceae bacterium]
MEGRIIKRINDHIPDQTDNCEWKDSFFGKRIRENLETALLEEVFTTPKPGLVDCHDNGAHTDMDCGTFIRSTYAISPCLTQMVYAGFQWEDSIEDLFPYIRKIGMQAEKAMFQATENVNTHKGIIFTMGILGAAAGYAYRRTGIAKAETVLEFSGDMVRKTMDRELADMDRRPARTHGEYLYRTYGEKGIRGEARDGFPIIRETSLPWMKHYISEGLDWNNVKINVLLRTIVKLNDTNVLSRGGYAQLEWIRNRASEILKIGGAASENGYKELMEMNRECIRRNISPGGAADILAATLFLYYMDGGGE